MVIQFYYDIVCPFAYLASLRLQQIASRTGAQVEYKPVLLGGLLNQIGTPSQPMDAMPPAKLQLIRDDAWRQADLAGAPFRYHPEHPRRTVHAMRLLVATPQPRRAEVTARLYRAYWVDNVDLADKQVVIEIAHELGLDPAVLDDPQVKQGLYQAVDEAQALGAFGVPTLVVDGTLWWGADRVALALAEFDAVAPSAPVNTGGSIEVFHDFSSPFSYLAAARIEALARHNGATVTWVPFLLGALFKQIGTPMIPLHAMAQARQDYYRRDLVDHARAHDIPFVFSPHFPLRTVTALRVALLEPETTAWLYRGAWVDEVDLGHPGSLIAHLDAGGFDGAALVAATQQAEVKEALKRNTERAVSVGACGAPTLLVNGQHLFWGQDRLQMVEAALRGWDAPTERRMA